MKAKHKDYPDSSVSEPSLFYRIMDRHQNWTVMICLVGLGQDIHDGEIGINEWFRCCIEEYSNRELFYSPAIFNQTADKNINREMIESSPNCHQCTPLHLKTSVRFFRSSKQSQFVDALLENQHENAAVLFGEIKDKYPIFVTRDLRLAKKWARNQVRDSQRCGVLACSSA